MNQLQLPVLQNFGICLTSCQPKDLGSRMRAGRRESFPNTELESHPVFEVNQAVCKQYRSWEPMQASKMRSLCCREMRACFHTWVSALKAALAEPSLRLSSDPISPDPSQSVQLTPQVNHGRFAFDRTTIGFEHVKIAANRQCLDLAPIEAQAIIHPCAGDAAHIGLSPKGINSNNHGVVSIHKFANGTVRARTRQAQPQLCTGIKQQHRRPMYRRARGFGRP